MRSHQVDYRFVRRRTVLSSESKLAKTARCGRTLRGSSLCRGDYACLGRARIIATAAALEREGRHKINATIRGLRSAETWSTEQASNRVRLAKQG